MKLGVTGTDKGITRRQRKMFITVLDFLSKTAPPEELHHGDCIGADQQFHVLYGKFVERFIGRHTIRIHPPINERARAWCTGGYGAEVKWYREKEYLERNDDIAKACDLLIAAPETMEYNVLRSGTWSTVRYAKKRGKPVIILWP
jgi:hypothetical protein